MQIGVLAGGAAQLEVGELLFKNLRLQGTTLRPRSVEEKSAAVGAFARDTLEWFASGQLAPVIGNVIKLADGESAYQLLATDEVFGKIVLDCT